jgi:hypothetical protein
VDSGYLFDEIVFTSGEVQEVEAQLNGYLWVNDPIGADSGWYTTISIGDLSGQHSSISNT